MYTYLSRQRQGKTHGELYKERGSRRIMCREKKERQQGNQQRGEKRRERQGGRVEKKGRERN